MRSGKLSICLVAGGMHERQIRLQPWRYLAEVALQLTARNHQVTVISDNHRKLPLPEPLAALPTKRLPTIRNAWWGTNRPLMAAISHLQPHAVIWHMGLSSLAHHRFAAPRGVPLVGLFTSPVYTLRQLNAIGVRRLLEGWRLSAMHLLGASLPRRLIARKLARDTSLRMIVFQTKTTAHQLKDRGIWPGPSLVIPPGVDPIWHAHGANRDRSLLRARLGYSSNHKVVVFFGAPDPLRGLPRLVDAFGLLRQRRPNARLLILSRCPLDHLRRDHRTLARLLGASESIAHIQLISRCLDSKSLVAHVAAADAVALPFELVPSDAPLSLLEARALGKPIVTTDVACLPELAGKTSAVVSPAMDTAALAAALETQLYERGLKGRDRKTDQPGASHSRNWSQVGEEWEALLHRL